MAMIWSGRAAITRVWLGGTMNSTSGVPAGGGTVKVSLSSP